MTDSLDGKTFEAGSASARGAYSLAAGSSFGKYRIVRDLGRGGMGEVYEVEHPVLHVRWALKVLPADFASRAGAVDRFKREAEVMAKLQHPNIVRVDDFGDTDGRYWLRMELVQGIDAPGDAKAVTVADLVEAHGGRLAQEEWLDLLGQMVEGLGYAHGRGAIHRDLKPSNILLAPGSDGKPAAKIADFGLVRIVGEEWVRKSAELSLSQSMSIGPAATAGGDAHGTSTHALLGTYEYMSPEQKGGGEADERSDIYALGLIAFRVLTGQKTLGFELPSEVDEGLAPGWDDLVKQALRAEPQRRPRDCKAFATLLARARLQLQQRGEEEQRRREEEERRLEEDAAQRRERKEAERKRREQAERRRREQEEIERRRRAQEEQHRREAAEAERRRRADVAERRSPPAIPELTADLVAVADAKYAPLEGLASGSREAQERQCEFSEREGLALEVNTARTGITLRLVPPGTYTIGTPWWKLTTPDEDPQRRVTIPSGLYVGKFEVTQGQWEAVMGANPSHFKAAGRNAPVENVSWHDC